MKIVTTNQGKIVSEKVKPGAMAGLGGAGRGNDLRHGCGIYC